MDSKEISFKEAFQRLKEIERELEREEVIDVEKLASLQKEAEVLHKLAETKLKIFDK